MTNKSMISAEKAREKRTKDARDEKDLGYEAAPDSPQLSPQIDEIRTRLQDSNADEAAHAELDSSSGSPTPQKARSDEA